MIRFATVALTLAVSAPAFAEDPQDIVGVASGNEDFSTLVAAVQAADLVGTLQGEGPFTVFAPTNDAFAALEDGAVEDLLKPENKDALVAVLTYHVVPGKVLAADVAAGEVATVQGDTIDITVGEDGTVMVDGATVVSTDVMASNGVIHVIDGVIMPTIPEPEPEPEPNIVNVAAGNDAFSTLVAAVQAAGLVETLSGEGPFTVFAPTNEAFAALGEDAVANLLKEENRDQLVKILTYHVLPGKVTSSDISSGKVATVQGSTVKVKAKKGVVTLNKKATVVEADIETTNGVIHVIDTVIMPK